MTVLQFQIMVFFVVVYWLLSIVISGQITERKGWGFTLGGGLGFFFGLFGLLVAAVLPILPEKKENNK